LFARNGAGYYIAVHTLCRYVQSQTLQKIIPQYVYLEDELQKKENKEFLQNHKALFCSYPEDELHILCNVTLSS